MTRVLNIVTAAYRGTVEEQDDTVLWLTAMCSGAGLDSAVLLAESAVSYGARGQDAGALRLGGVASARLPRLDDDLADLMAKGVTVHVVAEDVAERGIADDRLIPGLKPVRRADLGGLFGEYDQVWRW